MDTLTPTAIIVALLGAGGIGAFVRDLVDTIAKLATGRSATDSQRRLDIVKARDEALQREANERARADSEADARRRWQEQAWRLRLVLVQNGIEPGAEPETYLTIPRTRPTDEF